MSPSWQDSSRMFDDMLFGVESVELCWSWSRLLDILRSLVIVFDPT
jgi:hypothetical protein